MICPICEQKGIRVVSPVWYNQNITEACYDCITKLRLKGIKVYVDPQGIGHWKAKFPARLER